MRIGMGYDVHKLVENRDLILGGVKIPYEKGLLGHSDADVLLHAIMDALLGAAALGDIGKHFPDTDPAYKGASSMELLKQVGALIEQKLYVVGNIDATIIAQRPKMAPHMRKCGKMLRKLSELKRIRSILKRLQKKDLDLQEAEKESPRRPSQRLRRLQITVIK